MKATTNEDPAERAFDHLRAEVTIMRRAVEELLVTHGRELGLAAGGHGLGELGLGVVGEELPRGRGAPLLAHEQHGREGLGEQQRGAGPG